MDKGELISLIIPVYNVEDYLGRCVESVISQSYKNLQIILVDDGSTDNSSAICDSWAEKDERIEVIHKANGGLSDARNHGLDVAKGEYITFIDSDDYVDTVYVEYLYKLINDHKCDISVSSYYVSKTTGNEDCGEGYVDAILDPAEAISRMLCDEGYTVSACSKLYNNKVFQEIRYPVGKLCEDNGTTYKLFMEADKIAYGHESHYYYCVRSDSIMTSKFSWRKLDLIELTDYMAEEVNRQFPELRDVVARRKVYARMSVVRQAAEDKTVNMKDKRLEDLRKFVLANKEEFLNNPKMQRRDKFGYYSLTLGNYFFKKSWNIYKMLKSRFK